MITKEQFKEQIKDMTKEQLYELWNIISDQQKEITPKFSCRRGDIIKFWSTWTDREHSIRLERLERIAIALDDQTDTDDATCLEFIVSGDGGCWRYEPVRGDRFIEVIGHIDGLDKIEDDTRRMWIEQGAK